MNTSDFNQIPSLLPEKFLTSSDPPPWSAGDADNACLVGTPTADACFWQHQTTPFTCAVVAQQEILESFGIDVSEAQVVYDATSHHWLTDHGMPPTIAGNLLQMYGVPCHVEMGATVQDSVGELARGHKVIVGVDSGELWHQDHPLEDFFHQAADHAIWVTGVDNSDAAHPRIIINDSGDPHGAGKVYELADFLDAWQDSGFFYVATDQAPPGFSVLGSDASTGIFTSMADFLEQARGSLAAHSRGATTLASRLGTDQSSTVAFGAAGACWWCGGTGVVYYPSGVSETCGHCSGSGIGPV